MVERKALVSTEVGCMAPDGRWHSAYFGTVTSEDGQEICLGGNLCLQRCKVVSVHYCESCPQTPEIYEVEGK